MLIALVNEKKFIQYWLNVYFLESVLILKTEFCGNFLKCSRFIAEINQFFLEFFLILFTPYSFCIYFLS